MKLKEQKLKELKDYCKNTTDKYINYILNHLQFVNEVGKSCYESHLAFFVTEDDIESSETLVGGSLKLLKGKEVIEFIKNLLEEICEKLKIAMILTKSIKDEMNKFLSNTDKSVYRISIYKGENYIKIYIDSPFMSGEFIKELPYYTSVDDLIKLKE